MHHESKQLANDLQCFIRDVYSLSPKSSGTSWVECDPFYRWGVEVWVVRCLLGKYFRPQVYTTRIRISVKSSTS